MSEKTPDVSVPDTLPTTLEEEAALLEPTEFPEEEYPDPPQETEETPVYEEDEQ